MQECAEISPGKRMSPYTPDTMTLSCCSLAVRLSASPAANQPAVKPPTVKAPVAHQLVSIFCSTLCCQLCLYDQFPPKKTLASPWSGDSCCSLAVQSYTLPFADHPHDPTWKPKECEFLFKCVKCLEKRWSPSPFLSTPVVMNFVPSLWVANVKVWYQLKILSQDICI